MARIAVCGFENQGQEFGAGQPNGYAPGRLFAGRAFQIRNVQSGGGAYDLAVTLPTIKSHFWGRIYIRLRTYPSAGGLRFHGVRGSVENTDESVYLTIESDGTVHAYNKGNGAKTDVGHTTAALSLNVWHRITYECQFAVAGAPKFNVQIDGAGLAAGNNADNFTGTGFTVNGLGQGTQSCAALRFGSVGGGEMNGGDLDLDDAVFDDAAAPAAGGVALLHVNGQGTYNAWSLGGDFRHVIRCLPDQLVGVQTSTRTSKTSYTIEGISAKIGASATIKSARVCSFGFTNVSGWNYILRQNGTDNASPTGNTASTAWHGITGQPGTGWLVDRGALALAVGDTLEIGMQSAAAGVGTEWLYGIYLILDWEGPDPTLSETADVTIKYGTYVGNGTSQDVAFDDATFKPTFLVLLNDTAGAAGRVMWHRGMGYDGDNGQPINGHSTVSPGLSRVYTGGFSVHGAVGSCNVSGNTFRFLAVRDNAGRMMDVGGRCVNLTGAAIDNIDVPMTDGTFPVEAIIVAGQRYGLNSGTQNVQYRDTAFVGDNAAPMDTEAAATADGIQSMGTGTFQLGNEISRTPNFWQNWAGFKSTLGAGHLKVIAIGSYTGNGTNPRDISFSLDVPAAFVWVIPENANARIYRFFNDGGGTTSRSLVSGTGTTTGVTDFSVAGKFTVNSTLNTNLAVFHYIVFGAGTDLAILPEVLLPENGIGLTWVELTDRTGTMRPWAKVELADPSTYFGGFKESRVMQWGRLSRALSDRLGQFESADFSWVTHDVDRLIRGLLAADSTKYFRFAPVTVRMIDDDSRRLQLTPRTVIRGYVNDYRPNSQLHFEWKAQDFLTARFSAKGQKPASVPTRLIGTADFPNCPVDNQNLPVPIVYGACKDQRTRITLVPAVPDFDGSIPSAANSAGAIDLATPGSTFSGGVSAQVHGVINGKEGPISNPAGTYVPGPYQRAVGLFFNAIAGATSYRAYFYDGSWPFDPRNPHANGSTFARLVTVTGSGDWASRPFRDFSMVCNGPTDGADALNPQTTQVTVDDGHGAVKPIYVGDQTIGGTLYHKFLVAGHAVKATTELYVDGTPQYIATDASQAGSGGIWLIPGFAGWTAAIGATLYEDINGHRYCVVYGKAGIYGPDRGAGIIAQSAAANQALSNVPLALNVSGVETIGDGTGVLLTDIFDQYLHIIQNWILGNYQAGAWLTSPAFEDDSTLKQVDEASFTSSKAIAVQRISSGYVGAGIIGAEGAQITVRDLIARLNLSADCDSGFNRKTQFMVSMVDESIASQNSAVPLTDVKDIYSGSFDINDDLANHANLIPLFYSRDYTGNAQGGWLFTSEIKDSISITNYTRGNIDGTLRAPNLELWFVRDADTATDVAYRRLMRQKDPPRFVKLALGLAGFNYDLGQIVTLSHYEGVGAAGWTGEPMRIVRHEADPDQFQVFLECYDMAALFSGAFVLGDEGVLPAAWTSATTAQKNYGYLCDETTGKFSDGRPGKRLR